MKMSQFSYFFRGLLYFYAGAGAAYLASYDAGKPLGYSLVAASVAGAVAVRAFIDRSPEIYHETNPAPVADAPPAESEEVKS